MEEMGLIGEDFGSGGMERFKEEDYESRSISDNNDVDDLEEIPGSKRKKYHRHTPNQIQELENAFKDNPHPDEKARLDLGRRLSLEPKQIKFWFQNRRTQMKTQMERHENSILKQENDRLRIENIALKEAMRNPICSSCGGSASLGEISIEEQQLMAENARLRDERNRMCMMASKCLGRPVSSLIGSTSLSMSDLELGVGRNGFSGLSSGGTSMPIGFDFGSGFNTALSPLTPPRTMGSNSFDGSIDQSMYVQLAVNAMSELVKLAQIGSPMWVNSSNRSGETLNIEEYSRTFSPCIGLKPNNFTTQATRASGTVIINTMSLIEILMDSNRWAGMFPSIIGRAATIDVISSGMDGTRNGLLQLMQAQFQVLSPLVPVRQAKFLRFCEQQAEGVWTVVDVSVDAADRNGGSVGCRRLPSGCIVQDMPNGYSKVIWVEHMEYDESDVHPYFHSLLKSGVGFGAQRWVTNLERQCECLAFLMSPTSPGRDLSVINLGGRRSIAKLAQRMTHSFSSGICGTMNNWEIVQTGSGEHAKVMIRSSNGNPGEPSGVILSASLSVWMSVSHDRLFEFLRSEQTRPQWDVLSQDSAVQKMLQIAKGEELGSCTSLLRANVANAKDDGNDNGMLVLQDTSCDISGSMIVHAAVDIVGMNVVMSGGDSSCVALLPSGFAIFPDVSQESNSRPSSCNGFKVEELCGGGGGGGGGGKRCLLTVGFQILVSNVPSAKLTTESVETVNTLISRTVEAITSNLHCS